MGTLKRVRTFRRMLSAVGANEGIEILLNRLAKTQSKAEFPSALTTSLDAWRPVAALATSVVPFPPMS